MRCIYLEKYNHFVLKWNKIEAKIAKKSLIIISLIAFIGCLCINIIMRKYWTIAQFPSNVFAMQLSFSGEFLKKGYHYMIIYGDINIFREWQLIDFTFMLMYGIFGISFALLTGRLYPILSQNRQMSYYSATIMMIVPIFDAIENIISLYTLMNPLTFANSLAIIHSLLALIKWTLGSFVLIWALISWIKYSIYRSKLQNIS